MKMDTPTQISPNQVIVSTDYDDALELKLRDDLRTWNNELLIDGKVYDLNQVNDRVQQNDNFELGTSGESAGFLDINLGNFVLDDLNKVKQSLAIDDDNALTAQNLTSTDVPEVVLDGNDSDDIFDFSQNYVDVTTWGSYEKDSLTGSYYNDSLNLDYEKDPLTGSNL